MEIAGLAAHEAGHILSDFNIAQVERVWLHNRGGGVFTVTSYPSTDSELASVLGGIVAEALINGVEPDQMEFGALCKHSSCGEHDIRRTVQLRKMITLEELTNSIQHTARTIDRDLEWASGKVQMVMESMAAGACVELDRNLEVVDRSDSPYTLEAQLRSAAEQAAVYVMHKCEKVTIWQDGLDILATPEWSEDTSPERILAATLTIALLVDSDAVELLSVRVGADAVQSARELITDHVKPAVNQMDLMPLQQVIIHTGQFVLDRSYVNAG